MDRKDEIIRLQMDVISRMTQSNLRRIADDLWSGQDAPPAPSAALQSEPAAAGSVSLKRRMRWSLLLKRWTTCAASWKGTSAFPPSNARWKA